MQVYPLAKQLADCVIPAEYGITPEFKLRIGHKIAKELIGKLMLDLDNVKAESFSADQDLMARSCEVGSGMLRGGDAADNVVRGGDDVVRGGDNDMHENEEVRARLSQPASVRDRTTMLVQAPESRACEFRG